MDLEFRLGPMGPSMKETGRMIKSKGKESLSMPIKMSMKASLLPVKQTGTVNTLRKEVRCMTVYSKMTNLMVKVN